MREDHCLHIEKGAVSYGAIQAVRSVDLHLAKGKLTALIGANGAGKTTLLKAIVGLLPLQAGKIQYKDLDITRFTTWQRVNAGIALVPEGRGVFARMTVLENLALGAYLRTDKAEIAHDFKRGVHNSQARCQAVNSKCWLWPEP
jgi:branched-chain amino acid transport system ATP-binding protein